ncbi:MAG: error-prone DNA polymerase [Prosthecobacter sp.]
MGDPVFHELHARSAFSFLRGATRPEDMMRRAGELGMSHLVLTDRDGVYGSARAHFITKENGVKAIVGAELTMESGGVLPVIVRTRKGYQNLCHMLTRAKLAAPKGEARVSWTSLEEFAEGLTAHTGDGEGVLHHALNTGDKQTAVEMMHRLCRIFGEKHVHLLIQRHRVRHENIRVRQILDLAEHLRLPVIASNSPLYDLPEKRMLQDAFTCLRHHTHLDEAGLLLAPNAERCLKSAAQMRELFADRLHAVENTARVVETVEFALADLGYTFPEHKVPDNHTQDSYLREIAENGARKLYGAITGKVRATVDRELALICKLEFSGYFLLVWEIVQWARGQGILVQGRGSAANSVVCYCLGITKADPIASKLLFERFLSEGRNSWPDIDLDLPSGDQREKVIQEMYRRFAPYGAAMTANVITYRGRSSMREMSKVLNLPHDVAERFTDQYANGDFKHTITLKDQLRRAGIADKHARLPALITLLNMVKGLPRHLGQHSGGMVLCTKGLDSIVPLEPASMPGRVVVQWDKDDCEDLGIIKVDLLGLGMMAVLEETVATCAARGRPVDLEHLDLEDKACYEMMCRADTVGVFQIESRAQIATLPRLKPVRFYDLVVEVAIIRPGPIVGNLVHPYLKRRKGLEKIECIHPAFEPVLDRTLGVPLFQEQILQMAMLIADFSGSEAEELRRAMSFHRSEERMEKALAKLREAMTERSVEPAIQQRIVDSIKSFALYGFPESHAISFAFLAYFSVWLKVHRPVEFYTALLNCQPMGFYTTSTLVRDAKKHGLRILPVCVVNSELNCTVMSDDTLRLGLRQLRGVSRGSLEVLVAQRVQEPWVDLDDLLRRCLLSRDERRVLAEAGAFNALGHHRRSALWKVEAAPIDDLLSPLEGQGGIPLEMMTAFERMAADYRTTKLTVGTHPMGLVRASILKKACRAMDLVKKRHKQRVTIIGMVICRQRPGTANGHCFISLEDETGIANAFVPSDLFEKQRLVITQERFLQISGFMQHLDGVITVLAQRILPFKYEEMGQIAVQSHDFK